MAGSYIIAILHVIYSGYGPCELLPVLYQADSGFQLEVVVHKFLRMSYMVCEVCFGMAPSRDQVEAASGSRHLRDYDRKNMDEPFASMNVVRVCELHLNSKVASKQHALMHEVNISAG